MDLKHQWPVISECSYDPYLLGF